MSNNSFGFDLSYKDLRIAKERLNDFDISNKNRVRIENKIDKQKISDSPENYSPNVLLRPIYQEMILPNIAYVGGGGEISYWLQLRDVFSELSLSMPILVLRNSVLFIDEKHVYALSAGQKYYILKECNMAP